MSRAVRQKPGALAVGSVVAGRFRLEQHLGEGGMAEVFRAEDQTSGRRVAVKVLRADIATNREAVERAKREGELLTQLDNPAIVSVESWGELEDGTVFLVMELLEGETLGARMRRGPMDPAELAPVVAGTCAGLHAAHARGIVHRDLKPDNIFLCPTEHGLQVKLLDFGISKVYGGERLTHTGEVLGTPRYMSPEQLGAETDVDMRVDVYALGVILYEALAGKPPFLGSTPTDLVIAILNGKVAPLRSIRPELSAAIEAVVMRAMSKVRAARFDTAMALAEAYIDAAGGVAAARSEQRRGMATRAMGGMRVGPPSTPPPALDLPVTRPPEPPLGGDAVAGNLRLGTFSGLELGPSTPDEVQTVPGKKRRHDPAAFAATQEVPQTQARSVPQTRETPFEMADPAPEAAPPRKLAATALMELSQPIPAVVGAPSKPRARSTLLLVIGALFAGAASAGAVIGGLHLYDEHRTDAEGAPEPPVEEVAPPRPPESSEAEREPTPADEPAAAEPEAAPQTEEARPARAQRARRATPADRRERRQREAVSRGSPPPSPPAGPLQEAQQALRGGDPRRCIAILDEAIRQGAPALALRRRGDCYEAAGQRERAIADYQRFCRLVPENPSIADVRPLLESWGRTCP